MSEGTPPRTTLSLDALCAANDRLEDEKLELRMKLERMEVDLERAQQALKNLGQAARTAQYRAEKLARELASEL